MADPKVGQVVWRWSDRGPVPVTFVGRSRSWTRWKRGENEWNENGCPMWFDSAANCAWAEFESRVCNTGFRLKHFNTTREREAERAYEAACVYVRCFCDQFKTSPRQAWESPGGIPPERADTEKSTK